jgi:hypothetical protein
MMEVSNEDRYKAECGAGMSLQVLQIPRITGNKRKQLGIQDNQVKYVTANLPLLPKQEA